MNVPDEMWRKSNRSNNNGARVEARKVDGRIEVRNTNDPAQVTVSFTQQEWDAFLGGAKDGDFDFAG